MIAYLNGRLILKRDKFIILEVNNIGYKVFLSQQTLLKLPQIGENLKIYCYLNVGEAVLDLYGFLNQEELEFFETLNDIRGIGPKAALEISAVGPLEKIKDKILSQDENVFAGIPGIGQKRAQTIILELTGKIKTLGSAYAKASVDEAENGLVGLGFSRQQAKDALLSVPANVKNTEDRIKLALKNLGK